jgi:hypothetical protein
MTKLSEYESLALNKLNQSIFDGKWSNVGLIELIKLCGDHLNLETIPDYAKRNNISYPGACKDSKYRKNIELFNVKFIIDNE